MHQRVPRDRVCAWAWTYVSTCAFAYQETGLSSASTSPIAVDPEHKHLPEAGSAPNSGPQICPGSLETCISGSPMEQAPTMEVISRVGIEQRDTLTCYA